MRFLKKWSLFSCLLGLTFCKAVPFAPNQYEGDMLRFGKGGGITGSVTEFVLSDKGALYRGEGMMDRTFTKVKSLPRGIFSQMVTNYQVLGLGELEINQPGDLYFFLEYQHEGKTQRLVWGDTRYDPPKNLQLFYKILVEQTKE